MNTYRVISKSQGICVAQFNSLEEAIAYKDGDENLYIA